MSKPSSVPQKTIDRILELRSETDKRSRPVHTYGEIGKVVGLSEWQVRSLYYYNKPARIALAEVDEKDMPLMTRSGVVWNWPPYIGNRSHGKAWMRSCHKNRCKFWSRCKEAVARGDLIACEMPLERDMMDE